MYFCVCSKFRPPNLIPVYSLRYYVLLFLLGLFVLSCNDSKEVASRDAYLGGQIINPTSKYVVILKDNYPLDTVYLDNDNRFEHEIENVDCGFYAFKHLPETQNFYLEPGDSLLIRVNTLQFDESLHFSGTGSERNNFLVENFLLNEDNTDLLLSYYENDPKTFARETDSIKTKQLALLENLNKEQKLSEDFLAFAEKTIRYDVYDLRERYSYMINKYYKKFSQQLSDDFYQYRKSVDFNDVAMQTSPSYIRYIDNYLINRAMAECASANGNHENCYNLHEHENITTRIKLIDSLTNLRLIKEHFFAKLGALGIIMAEEREEIVSILELVEEKGYPKDKLQELYNIGNLQLAYLPGMNVSEIALFDTSGEERFFKEIADSKPVVVFLWSIYSPKNHKRNHKTFNELRRKYPEIKFIGINIDSGEQSKWKEAVAANGYKSRNEYHLKTSSIGREAFQSYLNKSLFIEPSGEVVVGNAYVNSPQFESRILEFLNR